MNQWEPPVVQVVPVAGEKYEAIPEGVGRVIFIRVAALICLLSRSYPATHPAEQRYCLRWDILVSVEARICPPRGVPQYFLHFLRTGLMSL
jgi:hypothetical protein